MHKHTCVAPGCEAGVYVKKSELCQRHYNRFMEYGDLNIQEIRKTCKRCGAPVARNGVHGSYPAYCSAECRNRSSSDARDRGPDNAKRRAKNAELRASTVKTCKQCSTDFTPEKSLAMSFCSLPCRRKYYRENNTNLCTEAGCDRTRHSRGMCSMHYKRWARSEGRWVNAPWDERRKANHLKRKAWKMKLPADNIRPNDVFERDGWVCGICGEPVDKNLQWPDQWSKSLDHVKPLSKGGHHVWDNVQLSHLDCNIRKNDEFPFEVDEMSA